jgi:rhomboid protease GluP
MKNITYLSINNIPFMAFGLSPKHLQEQIFDTLTSEEILITGLETVRTLNWKIGYTNPNGFVAYTKFSMMSWSEEVKVNIENQKLTIKSECTGSQLIDWGKNRENVDDFLKVFKETIGTLVTDDISIRYQEILDNKSPTIDLVNQPHQTSRDKVKNFFSIFIPVKGYFITPIILDINILVFVLMILNGVHVMLPDTDSLIAWGANFRPVTLAGQWWRLLTSCFLHIGIIHLLMNLYALLYIGIQLEPRLGKTRFLSAYLLTGIAGSANSLYWHELTVSAGASGAIFGMYGVFLAMLTTNLIEKSARQTMLTSIAIFVGYNLLNGVRGGIDNAAHIGGLIAGIVIGYSFYPSLVKPDKENLKHMTVAMLTLLIFSISFLIYQRMPNDIGMYDEKMNKFVSLESMALEFYSKDQTAPKEELLEEVQDRGIYYWKESIKVIADADRLNIPEILHTRNKKLIAYCDLRIKCYELIYKGIEENIDNYQIEIDNYNKQITDIINELSGQQ